MAKTYELEDLKRAFETPNGICQKPVKLVVDDIAVWAEACLSYDRHEKTVEEVEYFLLSCSKVHLCGGNAQSVLKTLNSLKESVEESDNDKIKLREYFDRHQKDGWTDDSWEFYSDWHKDLYGYRPHGMVCGEYVNPYREVC